MLVGNRAIPGAAAETFEYFQKAQRTQKSRIIQDLYSFLFTLQLPVYVPNEAEKADPKLYADNVRKMMVRSSRGVSKCMCLLELQIHGQSASLLDGVLS